MRVALREGDLVRKGEVVASILPPELDARSYREATLRAQSARGVLGESTARERRARLSLAQAERRLDRNRTLYLEGAISREAFDSIESDAEILRKEAESARSGVESARYALGALQAAVDQELSRKPVRVVAPAEGKVLRIHEKNERVVTAGSPLLDLGDPASIEILFDLLSTDAVRVAAGNKVAISEWGGGGELQGVVKRVEPSAFTKTSALGIEEKRVNIVAVLNGSEPLLGDNFRIQARIVLNEAENVLQIPVSALFRRGNEWHLFVVKDDRAVEKAIKTGIRGAFQVEVLGGLREGERVVVHPTNELRDGMRVKRPE